MYLRRWVPAWRRERGVPCRAWLAGRAPVRVVESGVGSAAMERALGWALEAQRRPGLVVAAGFAGGLGAAMRVGDVLLPSAIVEPSGECCAGSRGTGSLPVLFAAGQAGCLSPDVVPWQRGRLLSVAELVGDPKEKARLAAQHDAVAVDMESAVAARCCFQAGVPFACLRAISDDGETPLSPHLVEVLRGGEVAPLRLAAVLARRPWLAAELRRLARDTRKAARNLALGLVRLLGPQALGQSAFASN
jgi:adenosylhomocysteine nucleosidase